MTRRFSLVVGEGALDVAVAIRLLACLDMSVPERQVDKRGGHAFWTDAPRLNLAARNGNVGILALVDLERAACAPALIREKLINPPHGNFVLRVAVRMVEAWLLADRRGLANYFRISERVVPLAPDFLDHPKREIAVLARRSPKRDIRDDLVLEEGEAGIVGKGYLGRMRNFVETVWDCHAAADNSPSLARAIAAVREFGAAN